MLKPTIKRSIAVLLAIFMLILCTTGAYAAETPTEDEQPTHSPIYFGDITDDADNKPTIKDATLIQQYVADIKTLQNIRTYAFTKDGTLMTQKELINYLCDVNKDGEVNVVDATDIQRYLAGLDVKNTNLGKIAFEWRDAEYRNVYPNKEVEVVDEEAYDEQKLVIDKETITIKHPIYKSGYDCICNDCDMVMRWDDTDTEPRKILCKLRRATMPSIPRIQRMGIIQRRERQHLQQRHALRRKLASV